MGRRASPSKVKFISTVLQECHTTKKLTHLQNINGKKLWNAVLANVYYGHLVNLGISIIYNKVVNLECFHIQGSF